ncbi:MAG: two-component system response regulator [bacterium]|nr:MAG: two-component system response regulator [bacterium]
MDKIYKILIVEDNDMNRDMLSRRLKRRGFDIVMACNGLEAIDMAESESPDLILMDMRLPKLDGWNATRRLKASEVTKSIPVIALTAHAMGGDREKTLNAGCDEYETKPVDISRLLDKMSRFLDG